MSICLFVFVFHMKYKKSDMCVGVTLSNKKAMFFLDSNGLQTGRRIFSIMSPERNFQSQTSDSIRGFVRPLVGRSVGWSVGPSLITKMSRIGTIRLFERWRQSETTRRATNVVYTILLLPLPNSTRLNLSCIRPCYFCMINGWWWIHNKIWLDFHIFFFRFQDFRY